MRKILPVFFIILMFSYASDLHGSLKGFPKKLPDLKDLISDDGNSFDFSHFKGKVLLITYGYTSCPHVCPTILSYLKEVETVLNNRGYKGMFSIIFVSVDPLEDDTERLKSYKRFSGLEDFVFVTGDRKSLERVWRSLNVYVNDKGYTEMKHGDQTVKHR